MLPLLLPARVFRDPLIFVWNIVQIVDLGELADYSLLHTFDPIFVLHTQLHRRFLTSRKFQNVGLLTWGVLRVLSPRIRLLTLP